MGLEAPGTIDTLNPSWPRGDEAASQGDDHLRLIKLALQLTFPNITEPVTATSAELNSPAIPVGIIGLWSPVGGNPIPENWVLCDGNNNTPDLRQRFVMGHDPAVTTQGELGGSADAVLPSHSHTVSSGAHVHSVSGSAASAGSEHVHELALYNGSGSNLAGNWVVSATFDNDTGDFYPTDFYTNLFTRANAGSHSHSVSGSAASAGSEHTHVVSTEGASPVNANLPPYIVLAYIMYVGSP